MNNRQTQQPASPTPGQQVVWTSTDDRTIRSGKVTQVETDGKGHTRVTVEPETQQHSKVRK